MGTPQMRAATFEAHRLAGDPSGSFSAGLTNIPDNTVLLCRGAKLLQALHPFAAVPRGYSTTEEPRPNSQHRTLQIGALIQIKTRTQTAKPSAPLTRLTALPSSPYVPCSRTASAGLSKPGSEVMRQTSPSSLPSVPRQRDAPVRPSKE